MSLFIILRENQLVNQCLLWPNTTQLPTEHGTQRVKALSLPLLKSLDRASSSRKNKASNRPDGLHFKPHLSFRTDTSLLFRLPFALLPAWSASYNSVSKPVDSTVTARGLSPGSPPLQWRPGGLLFPLFTHHRGAGESAVVRGPRVTLLRSENNRLLTVSSSKLTGTQWCMKSLMEIGSGLTAPTMSRGRASKLGVTVSCYPCAPEASSFLCFLLPFLRVCC